MKRNLFFIPIIVFLVSMMFGGLTLFSQEKLNQESSALRFSEKFLLLAVNPQLGNFSSSLDRVAAGVSAALLFELNQQGKIEFRNEMVVVKDIGKTDDMILDFILEKVKKSRKDLSVAHWIHKIASDKRIYRICYLSLISLKLRGFITTEPMRSVDWKWNRNGPTKNSYLLSRFKITDINKVIALRNQLVDTLLDQGNTDGGLVTLISLLEACGLNHAVLSGLTGERILLKLKMDEIVADNTLGFHLKTLLSYNSLSRNSLYLQGKYYIFSNPGIVYSGCHRQLPAESKLVQRLKNKT